MKEALPSITSATVVWDAASADQRNEVHRRRGALGRRRRARTRGRHAREPFPRELGGGRDPAAAHFSDSLPENWFEQVTNERRRLRYRGNRPVYVFELARPGSPNEALDCCVYAYAVRFSPAVASIHLDEREARQPEPLEGAAPRSPRRSLAEWAAVFAQL